ncbi:hypothetical protein PSMA108079_06700 [Pseudoalteromonas mariniglutinosa]
MSDEILWLIPAAILTVGVFLAVYRAKFKNN